MSVNLTSLFGFILLGLIGGVGHVMVKAENWSDLKKFSAFKRSVIGAFCGFLYFWLHSDHNFPNTVMTIISGYTGTDFILGIVNLYRKRKEVN